VILVDSSVWITAFSKHPPFRIEELVRIDEIDDPMTGELFHEAILLFREARQKGVTVRS
jgi:predicted nucleic acid-binding protein